MPELSVNLADDVVATAEYLVVDEFLKTIVDARALKTAFELGLIDRLMQSRSGGSAYALGRAIGADAGGMRLLLDLLSAAGVVEERSGDVRLQPRFRNAMRFRDLMECKLDFVGFVLNDFADLFTALVRTPAGFMEQARLFQLFDYRRSLEYTPENYRRNRIWMRITSRLPSVSPDVGRWRQQRRIRLTTMPPPSGPARHCVRLAAGVRNRHGARPGRTGT